METTRTARGLRRRERTARGRRGVATLAVLTLALAGAAACDFTTGPDLVVEFTTQAGQAVPPAAPVLQSTAAGGENFICCCRVIGRAINASEVPVHVTLKFEAFQDGEEDPIGTAVQFLDAMQPGEDRDVAAPGFLRACDTIDEVVLADKDLRAVVQ